MVLQRCRRMLERDSVGLGQDRRDIFGLSVWAGSQPQIVAALAARITQGKSTQVAFLNAHLSNLCSTASGSPARSRRLPASQRRYWSRHRFAGAARACVPSQSQWTDLTSALLGKSRPGWRIFCLGALPEVVAQASELSATRWPQHEVVGFCDGYCNDRDEVRRQILDLKPDLILVGMGNPIQERWIAMNVPSICPVGIAVGAWFDFLIGRVPRAPIWMQRARCEWLFRLFNEPKRLASRYLIGNPLFLYRVAIAVLSRTWLNSITSFSSDRP